MSFAPILGPESSSQAHLRSLFFAYFASLAALCSSLLAGMSALVDDLAMRIPPSSCLVCQFKKLRASCSNTENKTTVLVFDPSTGVYTLKKIEDIDGESTVRDLSDLLFSSRTHYVRSRKTKLHLPQRPAHLSAIHQGPASRRNETSCRSPCRQRAHATGTEAPAFAGRWFLHHAREARHSNDNEPQAHARGSAGRATGPRFLQPNKAPSGTTRRRNLSGACPPFLADAVAAPASDPTEKCAQGSTTARSTSQGGIFGEEDFVRQ